MRSAVPVKPPGARTHTIGTDGRHAILALLAAVSTFNPSFSVRPGILLILVAALPDLLTFRPRAPDFWAVGFAVVMCASLTWTSSPLLTYAAAFNQVTVAIIFIAMRSAMRDRRALTFIGFGYLSGCVFSLWSLLREGNGARLSLAVDLTNRFAVSGLNTNYTAYALSAGIGVAIMVACRERRWWLFALIGALASYAGIVLTGSRAGILAAGAILLWRLVPRRVRRVGGWLLYATVAVGAIGIFTGWTDDVLRGNVGTASGRDTGQISGRLDVWPLARAAFSEHVWFGSGAGTFPSMNSYGIYAHNVFLDVGSGLGVVGLAVILALFYSTLVAGTRDTDPPSRALLVGVAVCCLAPAMLTGYWFQAPAAWVALAMFSQMHLVAPKGMGPDIAIRAPESQPVPAQVRSTSVRWRAVSPPTGGADLRSRE